MLPYNFLKKNTPRQVFFTFFNNIDGFSSRIIFNFAMHLDQQHRSSTAIQHFQYKTKIFFSDVLLGDVFRHGTCTQFSTKYFLSQASNLCCEVFKSNVIIKTTAAHFVKKVRWLSQKCFSTNYREHNMNLKVKET